MLTLLADSVLLTYFSKKPKIVAFQYTSASNQEFLSVKRKNNEIILLMKRVIGYFYMNKRAVTLLDLLR